MDTGLPGVFDGLVGGVDVFGEASGQTGHFHVASDNAGDGLDGFEVLLGGDGETGLDDVDVQFLELLGDSQFFRERHGGAGTLFAVAQSGVKNLDVIFFSHCFFPFVRLCSRILGAKAFWAFALGKFCFLLWLTS